MGIRYLFHLYAKYIAITAWQYYRAFFRSINVKLNMLLLKLEIIFHVSISGRTQGECLFISIYSLCRHSAPAMILFQTQSCADWA